MNWKGLQKYSYFEVGKGRAFARKWYKRNKHRRRPWGREFDSRPYVTPPPALTKGNVNK